MTTSAMRVLEVDAFAPGSGTVGRDGRELLWVGGRKANKGIDVLLATFTRLHAERPDLRLRLIGRDPHRAGAHDEVRPVPAAAGPRLTRHGDPSWFDASWCDESR